MWKYTQHSFAGGVQDVRLIGRQDLDRYRISARTLDNFMVMRQGCIQKRRGTNHVISDYEGSLRFVRLIPFVYERNESYLIAFMAPTEGETITAINTYKCKEDGAELWNHIPLGTYTIDEARELSYVQTGDVIILCHRNHPPARITRNAEGLFVYDVINFANLGGDALPAAPRVAVYPGTNKDAKGDTRTVYYAATAVGTDGRETLLGPAVEMSYQLPWTNTFIVKVQILDAEGNAITETPEGVAYYNIYKKTTSDFGYIGTTKGQQIGTRQVIVDYDWLVDENGNIRVDEDGKPIKDSSKPIYEEELVTAVTIFEDDYITPDTSITPPKREAFFNTATKYPATVSVVDQRLVFASTKASPYEVWWSVVGDFYNFNQHDSVRDDDGFRANIPATELPRINHIVATRDMLIFSDGAEWVAKPVSGEALTLKSLSFQQQSQVGASDVLAPTMIEDKVVFADATRETVHSIDYSFDRDGYKTQNLTILSQSLFDNNPIQSWAYAQHPDSTLWCVLKDGTLGTLAYMQEHELIAWSRQVLGGGMKAIDVVCTKEVSDGCSAIFILAEKTDGRTVILRVRNDVEPTTLKGGLCLDAMRLEEPPEEEETEGTEEEEEEPPTETPLADGEIAVDTEDGSIREMTKLPGRSYYVGYPFTATFRSVTPEAQGESTIQFELKDAISAELRIRNNASFNVVPTVLEDDDRQDVAIDTDIDATDGNIALTQKDITVELAGHSSTSGAVTLRCDAPYPLILLSMSINYELDPRTIGVE